MCQFNSDLETTKNSTMDYNSNENKTREVVLRTGNMLSYYTPQKAFQDELDVGIENASKRKNPFTLETQDLFCTLFPREEQDLIMKCFLSDDAKPFHVTQAVDQILEDLNCDYVDTLVLCACRIEARDHFEPFWRKVEELYDQGKVKNIGVCSFNLHRLRQLLIYARIPPAVNQVKTSCNELYNLLNFCKEHNITLLAGSESEMTGSTTVNDKTRSILEKMFNFSPFFTSPWTVRYSMHIKSTSVVYNRGYIINCSDPANEEF
eukprot:gb/GECH01014621.1/.p1 GENE.gb/GECH01014621.1/~~gb/GECH01014621.1/.p1  ORF type:complete len:263 (+),score=48.89 gb/GECH01014621.1/:1-789(+)